MPDLTFAPAQADAVPLHVLRTEDFAAWVEKQDDRTRRWAAESGFTGGAGQVLLVQDGEGRLALAAVGLGTAKDRARQTFTLGGARGKLPSRTYRLIHDLSEVELAEAALGWLLAGYVFDRYAAATPPGAALVAPEGIDAARIETLAAGEALTRDLINIPASDLGPAELEDHARALATQFGATFASISGDALLDRKFPLIHAVGRASDRDPRLIEMTWGGTGPSLTLVGKGITFDTGGLNLKPGASMGLMKKDMGGAANVLGLARSIMALSLPLRLRVLIPSAENAVSGPSFRPQDILTARNGLTVEVNNTDAEGRLVLADALAYAVETPPDLLVSFATLTGAARVALGPSIAPYFTDDGEIVQALEAGAEKSRDPVWRLPFWEPYEPMIEPGIADLDNSPTGGMAGAITAALFLRRFTAGARYLHFDVYGWQRSNAPARPKGGLGQGGRALFEALPKVLGL